MSTAIMGIPPEETQAFKTDIEYRLGVSDVMNDVLEREGVDEVILTYSADGPDMSGLSDEGLEIAMNGTVAEFLRSKGVPEEMITYVMSFEDRTVHGKFANFFLKAVKEGVTVTMEELKKFGEPLRPKELSPLELALYEVVKDEKNLTAWLGREIRLMKKEYGPEMDRADVIQFLFPLQSIKDWYVGTDRPGGMQHLSFKEAHDQAVEWEKALAGKGEGKYYGPVKPENILYLDPKTGFSIQNIDNLNDLAVEGMKMRHCVASYWDRIKDGDVRIISLRDPSNNPHITIELDRFKSSDFVDWRINQIKGFANRVPEPEYRQILARYFMTIPGIRYAHSNQNYTRTKGFRSLAIESGVGFNRWNYESDTTGHGRPGDLTDEETAIIIAEHTKNITAVLQHAKRYSWKIKKDDTGLRFEERVVGLDIKHQKPDEYGVIMVTEKREETKLNASIFGGDLRVFLGDVWLDRDQDRPLTPTLKQTIDAFIDVLVQVEKVENKMYDQWKKTVSAYLKNRKDTLSELKEIGPKNFGPEHFKKGLLKDFYEEQKRSENMPPPSYANQVFLLEKEIVRAESALSDRRYWQPISVKIVNIAPFSMDSFSERAQKMILDPQSKEGNSQGRWNGENALQYFSITLFEKINGYPMFAKE
jgi:hypothetical protein